LHCLTNFTFLRGASHPEELVERAVQLGYSALAITDECSLAGVVRAHVAAKEAGLKLIVGAELSLCRSTAHSSVAPGAPGDGPRRLRQSLGTDHTRPASGEERRIPSHLRRSRSGLPGCLALLLPADAPSLDDARWVAGRFPGNAWIAVELLCGPDDHAHLEQLERLSEHSGLPLVAAGDVHMHVRTRRVMQDTLTAIRVKRPVALAGHALFPNGERHLRRRERLAQIYPPELLIETVSIAERCRFSLDSLRYEYPEEVVPAGFTPAVWLRKLTEEGFSWRFGCGLDNAEMAEARCETRSQIPPIPPFSKGGCCGGGRRRARASNTNETHRRTGLEPYFLTVHDIVRFAHDGEFSVKAAGRPPTPPCVIASASRRSTRRAWRCCSSGLSPKSATSRPTSTWISSTSEEVIEYIYGKYGRDRCAAPPSSTTVPRVRCAMGKALGLDLAQVDQLAKSLAWWDGRQVRPERLREVGFDPDNASSSG
jgi:error-prone DNA polymerase